MNFFFIVYLSTINRIYNTSITEIIFSLHNHFNIHCNGSRGYIKVIKYALRSTMQYELTSPSLHPSICALAYLRKMQGRRNKGGKGAAALPTFLNYSIKDPLLPQQYSKILVVCPTNI